MTDDRLERAIDFLLKSQARHDARMQQLAEQADERQARTDEQLRRLGESIDGFADTQRRIMQVMTETLEAQAKINRDLRASDSSLRASDESLRVLMMGLAERQRQTEATVDRLSQKVEALAEQTAGTDRRLEALIKIVEGQRGGGQ